jgi:hypothetical protein
MQYEELQPLVVKILNGNLLTDLVSKFMVLRMLVTQQNETGGSVGRETKYVWLINE